MLAAPRHAQLHNPGNLLAKPHATGAMDTACHIGGNQRTQILVGAPPAWLLCNGTSSRHSPLPDPAVGIPRPDRK